MSLQFIIRPDSELVTTILQNIPDPSETATIQNISELSDETINNSQSITITNDSNNTKSRSLNKTKSNK